MNPFSAGTWLWRVWRTRSVTFAVLFAFALLGVSVLGGFRHALRGIGAPWYLWLLLPVVVVSFLARKEAEWMPDPEERWKWSLRLIFGSIVLMILIAKFGPEKPVEPASPVGPQRGGRADSHGR